MYFACFAGGGRGNWERGAGRQGLLVGGGGKYGEGAVLMVHYKLYIL